MLCVRYFPTSWGGGRLGWGTEGIEIKFWLEWGATFGTEKCLGCICYGSWLVMVSGIWYLVFGILVWYFGIIVAGHT